MFDDVELKDGLDRWITSESSIAYDIRMQRVIDARPHVCYGIAKPDDSEYNDVLMRRFGRVKDAESDVNIDKLESDIEHLQLLITTTCTTGADFLGVSHVYFVGTPVNKTEFRQNMYRAIRMCSHPLPNMQAGVKICTIGFNQTHEVCQNTIDRSDLVHRKFMANCIDAELDEHTGKVTSLYTVNAQTMPSVGEPLSTYEEYDKTFCSDVAELQDNRILKIRGDPYRYAPQFVVDDEETLSNFLRYTILPSPSVIRFVKDYKQASDVKKKMAVVLRYYYREHPSPDATHDADGTQDAANFMAQVAVIVRSDIERDGIERGDIERSSNSMRLLFSWYKKQFESDIKKWTNLEREEYQSRMSVIFQEGPLFFVSDIGDPKEMEAISEIVRSVLLEAAVVKISL
ncbi:hypothetical protein CYMTET_24674 [Cymbomonas tetramitiformis]|uniref:Uncharacterized protein n=1 Tax=Cymbomonas tetramitiformis TaxID=36881 RepID=A0AAE0FVE9_9CHLO|nr:hypothetical protein CYMTET_24674 [Cymbomonas tetramitiformis]